jgi:2'-5' RNA ligase
VPFAITLRLDTEAAASVAAMWEILASRGISDDSIQLAYPPHLTLATFPDNADAPRLLAAARGHAARWRALPVSLASLGVFPGTPATLFLAPIATPELLKRHAELLRSLRGEPIDPYYRTGHWVPHVTLASDLIDPAAALAATGPPRLPISGVLGTVAVVRFRPVEVLASHGLAVA